MPSLPSVLLVEDNPDDEALVCEAYRRAGVGYPLEVARDGAEALARALHAPANDFGELAAMMRNVAHYWLRHNEPPPAIR